jgi:hypothetical protein
MVRNGIEGAATLSELIAPHFGVFSFNAIGDVAEAVTRDSTAEEIGTALAGFYRIFDWAGPQVAFDKAPEDVQNLVLTIRDAAKAKITAAGEDPETYNVMPNYF